MAVSFDGELPPGVSAKDLVLAIIGRDRHRRRHRPVIEYGGEAVRALSMERG